MQGCACIEDKEVFGWAVHYFEEDEIKECKSAPTVKTATMKTPKRQDAKAEQKSATDINDGHKMESKPKSKKADDGQISFFDLFG